MSNFWKDKKILLTGHTGFKGTWLLIWLLELGAEVWGLSLPEENGEYIFFGDIFKKVEKRFYNVEGDILDKQFLNKKVSSIKPDIIFHLAAQAIVRKGYEEASLTWETNVIGSLNLLESMKELDNLCSAVFVTTDKVYKNNEWEYGYRENDELGGDDPYSASKAALEILISSWRKSFCGFKSYQKDNLMIASARAGNVIGGGDWSEDRIVPDFIRALKSLKPLLVRNPSYTRPWQHVLDPLNGYLTLARFLYEKKENISNAYNFGPYINCNKKVSELVNEIKNIWPGEIIFNRNIDEFKESKLLYLNSHKANKELNWYPVWDFKMAVEKTVNWYKKQDQGISALELCLDDINNFSKKKNEKLFDL